jgi:PRTRC genetic system protein A
VDGVTEGVSGPLVEYLVARQGLPPRRGLAYDYVLAGDGLFVAAENDLLSVRVPVASCPVRGLPPVHAACTLKRGRLPLALWQTMLRLARTWGVAGREMVCAVRFDPARGYRLVLPAQTASLSEVAYVPPPDALLELHSHHRFPARFSHQDDRDEQRLRLYGVVGRIDAPRPHVALRAGAYGYFLPLPWDSVFDGGPEDRDAVFDAHFDSPDGDPFPDGPAHGPSGGAAPCASAVGDGVPEG